jgi:hypothetical protein
LCDDPKFWMGCKFYLKTTRGCSTKVGQPLIYIWITE